MVQYYKKNVPFNFLLPEKILVGIETSRFNYYAAMQEESNWCWAASIQMVANYYGLQINQEEFAYSNCGMDDYGRVKNCPANIEEITTYLNLCTPKRCLQATANFGRPDINRLYTLLKENIPVILAYNTTYGTGHAIVLTGLSLEQPLFGNLELKSIIVRDPSPYTFNINNAGRVEYNRPWNILNAVYAWWIPTSYTKTHDTTPYQFSFF